MSVVQWWLAELDQYGNATLIDGAHNDRIGADRAAYLHQRLGFALGKRLAIARVELSEPTPSADGVDQGALQTLNNMGLKP